MVIFLLRLLRVVGVDRGVSNPRFPSPLSPLPSPSIPASLPLSPCFPPPLPPLFPPPLSPLPSPLSPLPSPSLPTSPLSPASRPLSPRTPARPCPPPRVYQLSKYNICMIFTCITIHCYFTKNSVSC